jgi:hypothetical protein
MIGDVGLQELVAYQSRPEPLSSNSVLWCFIHIRRLICTMYERDMRLKYGHMNDLIERAKATALCKRHYDCALPIVLSPGRQCVVRHTATTTGTGARAVSQYLILVLTLYLPFSMNWSKKHDTYSIQASCAWRCSRSG